MARAITGAEFDEALGRAERLLDSFDRIGARARVSSVLVAGSALAAFLLLALIVATGLPAAAAVAVAVVGVAGEGLTIVAILRHVRALHAMARRDERAMLEVVDMLRELLPDIAKEEGWGPARVQIAAARVSRFPIGRRGSR